MIIRGFSQTSPHKATPATFTAGIRPSRSLIASGIRHTVIITMINDDQSSDHVDRKKSLVMRKRWADLNLQLYARWIVWGKFYVDLTCATHAGGEGPPDGGFSKWICCSTSTDIRLRKMNICPWWINSVRMQLGRYLNLSHRWIKMSSAPFLLPLIYSPIFIPQNTSHCCNSYCDLINENSMHYSHLYLICPI